jgi:hypothetical protein
VFGFDVPGELEAGAYAHAISVWYSATEFTLDFGVSVAPAEPGIAEERRVLSRVRIPPTFAFELIRVVSGKNGALRSGVLRDPGRLPR